MIEEDTRAKLQELSNSAKELGGELMKVKVLKLFAGKRIIPHEIFQEIAEMKLD